MNRSLTPPIRGAKKLYSNAMIALIINPPIKEIMGVIIMDPTPKSKPNTPKLKGLVVEEGTLANIAPNSTA